VIRRLIRDRRSDNRESHAHRSALPNLAVLRSRAAPLRGTAGAPAAGLRGWGHRPGTGAPPQCEAAGDQTGSSSCCPVTARGRIPRRFSVQLAATGSRAALRAVPSGRPLTRRPLPRIRRLRGNGET